MLGLIGFIGLVGFEGLGKHVHDKLHGTGDMPQCFTLEWGFQELVPLKVL